MRGGTTTNGDGRRVPTCEETTWQPCNVLGDLEVGQDLDFQRREWAVQRVGWGAMALVILAALLGLFGSSGPLSRAATNAADDLVRLE